MAKASSAKKTLSNEEIENTARELIVNKNDTVDLEAAFDAMENVSEDMLENLSVDYFKFTEKGRYILIVLGIDETTMSGKPVKVVRFMDRDQNTFINGDKMFVSGCERLKDLPSFVAVDYLGEKKSANGGYKDMSVKALVNKEAGKLPF